MEENYTTLDVELISFDVQNPRIKKALEKYGDKLNAERIHFALRSASENGTKGTSSYNSLKDSILASCGAKYPITVVKKNEEYICIDGNTRLSIYKQFKKEGATGDWSKIKAAVLENATQRDIETIRVSAHLVGAREWPAYEKARYLHYLRNENFMEYGEMIALCGGNKTEIERQIDAYHDMNEYYRDIVDDNAFNIERYSGFVVLQNPNVKKAIFDAGLDLKDFGEWIRDGKIYRLADARKLPQVLGDDAAKTTFLDGGPRSIEDAIRVLDQKRPGLAAHTTLKSASLYDLADVLTQRLSDIPHSEVRDLRNRESDEAIAHVSNLESLSEQLQKLLEDVSE